MKVIKYGEGYEPKFITCDLCKSELEYTIKDVQYQPEPGGYLMQDDRMVFVRSSSPVVICPVCGKPISLGSPINDYT